LKSIILCYHKVGTEAEEGRWLNCSPEKLSRHARFFARKKIPGFLPRDYVSSRPKGICFTFDDAYVSATTHAPDVLEASGYRGAFYAVPSLVGLSSTWDKDLARPLAGWDVLKLLQHRGHEIGNHTMTHKNLGQLTQEEQVRELIQAHEALLVRGFESQTVCFPYGGFSVNTADALRESGYRVGLQLGKKTVRSEPSWCLPRVVVAFSDSIPKLLYKIYVRPLLP
jgi:peptidoglycan/xylan/chitin deacetylase (PgdA/CDA1 family)